MPRMGTKKVFSKLKVHEDKVLVSGGFNSGPKPCFIKYAQDGPMKLIFLRVNAREDWLTNALCGDSRIRGGLSQRTTLLNDLRAKLEEACAGEPTTDTSIRCNGAASASVVTDASDPMAAVADDDVVESAPVVAKYSFRRAR